LLAGLWLSIFYEQNRLLPPQGGKNFRRVYECSRMRIWDVRLSENNARQIQEHQENTEMTRRRDVTDNHEPCHRSLQDHICCKTTVAIKEKSKPMGCEWSRLVSK